MGLGNMVGQAGGDATGVAVVTGASSGIGAVYADRLAARGHDLLLVARRADRLRQLAQELSDRHGVQVQTATADLAEPESLARVEALVRESNAVLLVNNAGAGGLGPTAAISADRVENVVRLNITALSRLSHAVLEGFRSRGAGTLVNIGSIIALSPSPSAAAYSGSKAYVLNFTRSLQAEYADTAIRIQLVQPGPIRTEFFTAAGVSESVFPEDSYLTAEQLVDAALAGLDAGELVTTPTVAETGIWEALEAARLAFMEAARSGQVAERYRVGEESLA
ncbi:SDR family NAD(P)-dependent oxidoreductase [Sphingobium indicum]